MKHTSRLILFLNLSFICFGNLNAQYFEGALVAGISGSQVDGDTQGGYKKPGIIVGLSVEKKISRLLGLKSGIEYIGKGAVKKIDNVEEFNTSLHYVQIPFTLSINPLEHVEVNLGLAGAYLFHLKYEYLGQQMNDDLNDMHNFELSALLNFSYFFSERIGCNAGFNYSILAVKNNPNWFNNNINLTLIYKFGHRQE